MTEQPPASISYNSNTSRLTYKTLNPEYSIAYLCMYTLNPLQYWIHSNYMSFNTMSHDPDCVVLRRLRFASLAFLHNTGVYSYPKISVVSLICFITSESETFIKTITTHHTYIHNLKIRQRG